jgi:transcription antitermination factor NusG
MQIITKTSLFLSTHSELVAIALELDLEIKNNLGTLLPHTTLQKLIWKHHMTNNITENTTIVTNTRDLESSWYVLHTINGQEQIVMDKVNNLINNNAIDRKNNLIDAGYINTAFKLSDYILDIGFPREYDLVHNKQDQSYNTYIFIEIAPIQGNDLFTGQEIFNQVFLPLLQRIEGVKDFVGTYEKVPGLRKTEIIRMNKRDKISRKQVEKIKPSKLQEKDYVNIERSHSSFSYYEDKLLKVDDVCWFTPSPDKPHYRHLVKVVKLLTYDKFQVVNNIGTKYVVSINNLTLAVGKQLTQQENKITICSKVSKTKPTTITTKPTTTTKQVQIVKVTKPVTVTKVTRLPDVGTPLNLYRTSSASR